MCKLPTTAQITAAMLKTIYKKASFDSLKNSNNYVLIMNIIGSLTEDHRAEPATYFVDLNFEKLMIKLEKAVIN